MPFNIWLLLCAYIDWVYDMYMYCIDGFHDWLLYIDGFHVPVIKVKDAHFSPKSPRSTIVSQVSDLSIVQCKCTCMYKHVIILYSYVNIVLYFIYIV